MLRRLKMRRYRGALRRGGSQPIIVDTDSGRFVAKLRATGHGVRALVAEIIAGELARAATLPVLDLVLLDLGERFECDERDPEITDLIDASAGVNLGFAWLDDARDATAAEASAAFDAELAADILWFDAFAFNPDRTPGSPNVLLAGSRPYLIDHGSALLFHHDWPSADSRIHADSPVIDDHVLLEVAGDRSAADRRMTERLAGAAISRAIAQVPDELIAPEQRGAYDRILSARLAGPRTFVERAGRSNRTRNRPGHPEWVLRAKRSN